MMIRDVMSDNGEIFPLFKEIHGILNGARASVTVDSISRKKHIMEITKIQQRVLHACLRLVDLNLARQAENGAFYKAGRASGGMPRAINNKNIVLKRRKYLCYL